MKTFSKMIYVLEQDGKPKYAITALGTLVRILKDEGFDVPSKVTVKSHIDKKGAFEMQNIKIYDLGLFTTKYKGSVIDNLKG